MMNNNFLYITFWSILLLNSCQIGKRYIRPQMSVPQELSAIYGVEDSIVQSSSSLDSTSIAQLKWWQIYPDSMLQQLLYRTLEHNKDLKIADARVKELAAMNRVDFSNLFPRLNANAYGQKEGRNYGGNRFVNDPEFGVKLTLSWEADLWGNLRWNRDKSKAFLLSSIEMERALKISVIAQVAQAYFELMALDNELFIVRQTLYARAEGARLAKLRFEGGLTSETSFQQAQLEYTRTRILVPDLDRKISIKQNEIAFLAGDYPTSISRTTLSADKRLLASLPMGLSSDLLERRPDIREAEQKLIAANASVGVAYTNMFPRLNLTAQFGAESEDLNSLLKSPLHYLSANLIGPVFAMGRNRALHKASQAAFEQECSRYERVVLNAFREVHNAIVNFNKIKEVLEARQQFEAASKVTMEFAQLQYINGVIGYLDVLDAQRNYFDAQISLSNAIRDQQITMVQLYKALGGGW
ncbi:MAG: efflux transporter outer membrane subunit [Bacteroidales bacterium]